MGNSPRAIARGLLRGGRAISVQWDRWGLLITLTCVLVAAGSVALYFFDAIGSSRFSALAGDPASIGGTTFYAGVHSTLSTILWSAAMTIWLLGAFLLRGRTSSPVSIQFFLTTALFSFLLVMEDALVIPYVVLQSSSALSVKVLMAANGLFILVYVWSFARQILESEYLFFIAALACFGASMAIDSFARHSHNIMLFSDCFMLVGVVFWVLYPAMTIPFFLHRVQLLEWSRDTLRFMVGEEEESERVGEWGREGVGEWGKV